MNVLNLTFLLIVQSLIIQSNRVNLALLLKQGRLTTLISHSLYVYSFIEKKEKWQISMERGHRKNVAVWKHLNKFQVRKQTENNKFLVKEEQPQKDLGP